MEDPTYFFKVTYRTTLKFGQVLSGLNKPEPWTNGWLNPRPSVALDCGTPIFSRNQLGPCRSLVCPTWSKNLTLNWSHLWSVSLGIFEKWLFYEINHFKIISFSKTSRKSLIDHLIDLELIALNRCRLEC